MYIINPSTFYWFSVLSSLKTFATVVACFGSVGTALLIFFWIYNYTEAVEFECSINQRYARILRNASIWVGILTIVCILAAIFLPSREASVEISLTQVLTRDNINWTVGQVKEIVDYVVKSLGR